VKTLLESMQRDLHQYKNLEMYTEAYPYKEALDQLRRWQTDRLLVTHRELLEDPYYRNAAEFVLYDVYGGINLCDVVHDIQRALPVAVKLFSKKVMETAAVALELNLVTAELDQALVKTHFDTLAIPAVTDQSYIEAVHASNQFKMREHQIHLAQQLGNKIDRYIVSRMIYAGFKMAKGPAQAAGLDALYQFMQRGFDVLRPLGGAEQFLVKITTSELEVLSYMRNNRSGSPFSWPIGVDPLATGY